MYFVERDEVKELVKASYGLWAAIMMMRHRDLVRPAEKSPGTEALNDAASDQSGESVPFWLTVYTCRLESR